MELQPSFEAFKSQASHATVVPVWREFLFDVDTAVTAFAKIYRPPFGFLLESVVGGDQWARYTFLGTEPSGAWRLRGERLTTGGLQSTPMIHSPNSTHGFVRVSPPKPRGCQGSGAEP